MSDITLKPGQSITLYDGTTGVVSTVTPDVVVYGTGDHEGETHDIPASRVSDYIS